MEKRNFVVLGGDQRNLELVHALEKDGHKVRNLVKVDNQPIEFNEDEIIIGPLPFSHDNKKLDAPFCSKDLYIEAVFKAINDEQHFIAGNIHEKHMEEGKKYNIRIIDYFKREEMQVYNAIPTAEGAIQVAMENLPVILHRSNVLVLGYGRIGKALSNAIHSLGANTHVAARNFGDLAWIENLKYYPIQLKDIDQYLNRMDVIFNTIPALVLTKDQLRNVRENSLIIDLASKPGGVDFEAAKDLGINAIHSLGLPGKYAPVSAAHIIKETIYNIIEERSM